MAWFKSAPLFALVAKKKHLEYNRDNVTDGREENGKCYDEEKITDY